MTERADELAARIRPILGAAPGITEKRMFGGHGFMHDGNMIVGAMSTGQLLARVDRSRHEEALKRPGASTMHQGGRDMVGFIFVDGDGIETDEDLEGWIAYCLDYVKTLPPKAVKKPSAKRAAAKKAPTQKSAAKKPARKR